MSNKTRVLLSVFCLTVLLNVFDGLASDSKPLLLGCGSAEEGTDEDGRKWGSDSNFLNSSNSVMATAQFQEPSLTSQIPYMDARIFTSEATYNFPVVAGKRYWLRLHFYPAVYGSNNAAESYFSVMANELTLLKNFSAQLTCQAFTQAYIVREYSIAPSNSDLLRLQFKPDVGFAFINGIELIPMPDLFDIEAALVGASDQTVEVKSSNLQTMFRLNVGGQYISPINDSGLSRTWYDDLPYIYGAATGVTNEASQKVRIKYKNMPQYVAPVDIYRTSRSMGNDKNVNLGYNLTWVFQQIDPDFMYLVRLHFCDYFLTKANQIVFDIFVNNQTAQNTADVIAWSGGKGVPIYKDFAIYVSKDEQLWLALHPSSATDPEFYDAILNGVEIFKLDSTQNLAGPNPSPSDFQVKVEAKSPKSFEEKHKSNSHVIGGAAGGAAAVVVAALCFAVYQKKNRVYGTDSHTSSWLPIQGNSHSSGSKSMISGKSTASSLAQGLARHFSLPEILQATKRFDESNVIGVGGFGKVYKGVIDGGTKVAIKRSNPSSEQGVHEFLTEIDLLSKLRHKHLVSLIGFCDEDNEMCLVYDYMGQGTLREHIYKTNKTRLSWKQRLEICIGAARGLHYLHTGAQYTIIHRDVKTTNILLDDNWVAKVSDFGLSKTGPNMANGHVSTVVKGSFGYLDPEYFRRQQLTEKSDVYSFGVVLFEVLCARPALNPSLPKEQVSLADWALHCIRKGILEDIIDPHLKGKINPECLKKFTDAAEKCLDDHGLERPSMGDVLWNLEFALQLQETEDGSTRSCSRINDGCEIEDGSRRSQNVAVHYNNLSLGSEHELTEESKDATDHGVFSQIVNPKGGKHSFLRDRRENEEPWRIRASKTRNFLLSPEIAVLFNKNLMNSPLHVRDV